MTVIVLYLHSVLFWEFTSITIYDIEICNNSKHCNDCVYWEIHVKAKIFDGCECISMWYGIQKIGCHGTFPAS